MQIIATVASVLSSVRALLCLRSQVSSTILGILTIVADVITAERRGNRLLVKKNICNALR
jgi:hypothetical protein